MSPPGFFIVRNIRKQKERLTLTFDIAPGLARAGVPIHVILDETLARAFHSGEGRFSGLKPDGKGGFLIVGTRAVLGGLLMTPREQGHVKIQLGPTKPFVHGDITITQASSKGVDGGVTIRLTGRK
jgi:hypothetical protein